MADEGTDIIISDNEYAVLWDAAKEFSVAAEERLEGYIKILSDVRDHGVGQDTERQKNLALYSEWVEKMVGETKWALVLFMRNIKLYIRQIDKDDKDLY